MSKIYNTQTDLRIVVDTGRDITTATEVRLKYRNPQGTTGEFTVTVTNAAAGIFEYVTPVGQPFTISGVWTFWARIVDNGLISIGNPFQLRFRPEGYDL